MSETVIGHVLRRLKALGADAVFGVPGDFAFNVQDAIVAEPGLHWIGCCNELNAGYAADGYARRRGIGVLSTTYGVGELSALNAVAGSYAENVAVVHLTGMPAMPVQHAGSLVHHTLGTGEFDLFRRMADTVTCASAIMTPTNVVAETHRLLTAALYHRRPVYMAFPSDLAAQPVAADVNLLASPIRSRPDTLRAPPFETPSAASTTHAWYRVSFWTGSGSLAASLNSSTNPACPSPRCSPTKRRSTSSTLTTSACTTAP